MAILAAMEEVTRASARSQVFYFKQFEINQQDCVMKINTDGVLLGALASFVLEDKQQESRRVLDIGTGTGVIALMLAQRFPEANIEAIELDEATANRATANFERSIFSSRLRVFHQALRDFTPNIATSGYHLIVSNPPFFVNALQNPDQRKRIGRHADWGFFEDLLRLSSIWLADEGRLQLILPVDVADIVKDKALKDFGLCLESRLDVFSFVEDEKAVRSMLTFMKQKTVQQPLVSQKFVIYAERGVYSDEYKLLLRDFFLNF